MLDGSIESADGVGVKVEIAGIFGHYSRDSFEVLKPPARAEMMQDRAESEDGTVLAFGTILHHLCSCWRFQNLETIA